MTDILSELIQFIDIAEKQGFKKANTAVGLRTAVNKLLSILEPDQQTLEYVKANLPVINARFQNLNKDVRGQTADEYARRVEAVIAEFERWTTDRAGWERDAASSSRSSSTSEKPKKAEKVKATAETAAAGTNDSNYRVIRIPLPNGVEVEVKIPRDITIPDIKRIAYALLPYAKDWDPEMGNPRQVFAQLENSSSHLHQ